MKKTGILTLIITLPMMFFAFRTAEHTIKTILSQLDISEESANNQVLSNILYSSYNYPFPGSLKNTPMDERPAIVKIIGGFAKVYTKSDDFKRKYLEYQESKKPAIPEAPIYASAAREQYRAEYNASLKEMIKLQNSLPADQKTAYDEAIKMITEMIAGLDDPDNPVFSKETDNVLKQQYEAQLAEYNNQIAEWERNRNGDPQQMVKKWISEFLDVTKDIDFNAELKSEYGKKKFVNQEYESKPPVWKLCFRAGKSTTETARAYAQTWLSSL
ncbi:MAG: hypothetical protein WCJ01_09665 [Ignavibacteria bacterium]